MSYRFSKDLFYAKEDYVSGDFCLFNGRLASCNFIFFSFFYQRIIILFFYSRKKNMSQQTTERKTI